MNSTATSKYIKPAREIKIYDKLGVFFLFSLFVMPQYFGLPFPMFDFTLLRIMIIVMFIIIFSDTEKKKQLLNLVMNKRYSMVLIPYIIVTGYTMVLRIDFNAFLNPFLELIGFYLTIYVIKHMIGVERTLKLLITFMYILVLLGVIEYVMTKTPFSYLETIKGIYTGAFIRSGNYRIMGPCNHSLGYGLLLIAVTPLAAYDIDEQKIDVLRRPILMALIVVNVLLTGSRSTLAILCIELVLLFLFTNREMKKKCILLLMVFAVFMTGFLVVFHNTGIARYILLQITSVIDTAFGTSLSENYGANREALDSSTNYRDQLKYIFSLTWLNPVLGIGRKRSFSAVINGSFIKSVDDFYIAEYIRYSYTGLVSYVIFILYFVVGIVKRSFKEQSSLMKILLVGIACYLINLKWVDSLQTLKYLYILFAIYAVTYDEEETLKKAKHKEIAKKSKYIKQ